MTSVEPFDRVAKKVPTIEVTIQTAPMASGSIMISPMYGAEAK